MKAQPENIAEGAAGVFGTLREIEDAALSSEELLSGEVRPIRKLLIKRFPVFFLLLVTVGFVSVSFGLEEILHKHSFFSEHPYLVMGFGLLLLVFTGTAYKRNVS